MIEQRRPCNHCGHMHVFVAREDDRETCPKCGGDLYPIVTILTDAGAAAERIERSLLDSEALACWTRIDDVSGDEEPVVKDVAERLAKRAITPPMERVLHWARTFARERRANEMTCHAVATSDASNTDGAYATRAIDVAEARKGLEDAATGLVYGCRSCGSQLVRLDEGQLCRDCAAPTRDLEAEFDARCWAALAAFKEDPKKFVEATREIVRERPGLTMVEFVARSDRATKFRRSAS